MSFWSPVRMRPTGGVCTTYVALLLAIHWMTSSAIRPSAEDITLDVGGSIANSTHVVITERANAKVEGNMKVDASITSENPQSPQKVKLAMFSSRSYDKDAFNEIKDSYHQWLEIRYYEDTLKEDKVALARMEAFNAVSGFVNDDFSAAVLQKLNAFGIKFVAMRCTGVDRVDKDEARRLGMSVAHVPEYSPDAIADHAVALMLSLERHLPEAATRVSKYNFNIEGLRGDNMNNLTVGIIGAGKIGGQVATILKKGFGCTVLAWVLPNRGQNKKELEKLGIQFVDNLEDIYQRSDIISLHLPLLKGLARFSRENGTTTDTTEHLIDKAAIEKMKPGVMIINTGRGALIDSNALLAGLDDNKVGSAGLDVVEEEQGIFFDDFSDKNIKVPMHISKLARHPKVQLTSHQGFLTKGAMKEIAATTVRNIEGMATPGGKFKDVLAST